MRVFRPSRGTRFLLGCGGGAVRLAFVGSSGFLEDVGHGIGGSGGPGQGDGGREINRESSVTTGTQTSQQRMQVGRSERATRVEEDGGKRTYGGG